MIATIKYNASIFYDALNGLRKHRILLLEMTKRDLLDQYVGQLFGFLWIFLHPVVLLLTYVFVFDVVLKIKIGGTQEMPLDYTVYILSGLVPWIGFQASMSKAATALTGQSNLVKQVVFPIEVLPEKMALSSMTGQAVSLILLIIYVLCVYHTLPWSYLLLPLLLGMQFLLMFGTGFFLSALTPFFKDTKDIITVYCVIGIYLAPVVYLPDWIPSIFKPLLYANPISYLIWCYQDVLYFGHVAHPWAWPILFCEATLIFLFGYRFFNTLRPYFGNVL